MKLKKRLLLVIIITLLIYVSCTYIAPYNQHIYEQATSLKVEAISLVEKANEPYKNYFDKIEEFKLKMLKAYEYTKGIPKNYETSEQWAILINPEGKSMFGFLNFWRDKSTLSKAFIDEYKREIEKHFNKIIELEARKIKGYKKN